MRKAVSIAVATALGVTATSNHTVVAGLHLHHTDESDAQVIDRHADPGTPPETASEGR